MGVMAASNDGSLLILLTSYQLRPHLQERDWIQLPVESAALVLLAEPSRTTEPYNRAAQPSHRTEPQNAVLVQYKKVYTLSFPSTLRLRVHLHRSYLRRVFHLRHSLPSTTFPPLTTLRSPLRYPTHVSHLRPLYSVLSHGTSLGRSLCQPNLEPIPGPSHLGKYLRKSVLKKRLISRRHNALPAIANLCLYGLSVGTPEHSGTFRLQRSRWTYNLSRHRGP